MTTAATTANIADRMAEVAARVPGNTALVTPEGSLTYEAFARRVDEAAHALQAAGLARGMRTVMLVPAGHDFFVLVFALFKLGAVPVFIDPMMGFRTMGRVIAEARPEAFVAIPKGHLARVVGGWGKASLRRHVTVGRWAFPGTHKLATSPGPAFPTAATAPDDVAAILFTSGSTGTPKGVLHTHAGFSAQTDFVRDQFSVAPGEVHVAAFPIFALFGLALGATAVLPAVDMQRPARIDPAVIVAAVEQHRATCLFGSPAMLDNLGSHVQATGRRLPHLRAVISASGPVLPTVLEKLDGMVTPEATVYIPYGATEGLPISVLGHREALSLRDRWAAGEGLCIGYPLTSVVLEVMKISDRPVASWADAELVEPGQVGEIVVKGPIISRAYLERPEANRMAKIPDGQDVWHRMGDLGRLDERGRLWFYGRKAHRVEADGRTFFTIACEAVFLQHPWVRRAALVGVRGKPVVVIEPEPLLFRGGPKALFAALRELALQHPHTAAIDTFMLHERLPVDIRHNSKIFREALAVWAAEQLP